MIPLVTAEQVRHAERDAIDAGRTEADLMFLAGSTIANAILRDRMSPPHSALVLCGPGKNGGDGLVIADHLSSAGTEVSVWLWNRDGIGEVPVDRDLAERVRWIEAKDELNLAIESSDIIVDAIFGTGSRAELPEEVTTIFARVQEASDSFGIELWAVDLPSGIDADSGEAAAGALFVDTTAMIGLPKVGAYRFPAARHIGFVEQIDINLKSPEGLETENWLISAFDARQAFPNRRAGIHKRSAGTVFVIGGAPNYYGAPRLTSEAALRSGAGLVSLAAPSSIIGPIASAVPELTFVPLPVAQHGTAGQRMASIVREHVEHVDAIVIGPGLGTESPVPEFLGHLLGIGASARRGIGFGDAPASEPDQPFTMRAVLDADALNWLATQPGWETKLSEADLVLTPHPGELARLLGVERNDIEADPWGWAQRAAESFNQTVVLKYGHSVVATPDGNVRIAPQAPVSLATAGTGDVLAGVIGSLMSQGVDSERAAMTGIIVGLRASEIAEMEIGRIGVVASDIILRLPIAIAELTGFRE